MATGAVLFPDDNADNHVDAAVEQARRAFDVGVRQVWLGQRFDYDAITLAGVIGSAVPGLGVGTAAVPINPRHPLVMASLAQTAQAAAHGNFSLGVALGGHPLEQRTFGTTWPAPVDRLREHLQIVRSAFADGEVHFQGDHLTADSEMSLVVPGGTPVPTFVAAMGPRALRVTGELSDGTITRLAGPRTLAEFITPTITAAAADAGQPSPQIIAIVDVLVTDDVDAGRGLAAQKLAFYQSIPSYQRVIEREGVDSIVDLAAIGDADAVRRHLRAHLDAGATDVVLSALDQSPAALERVWEIVTTL